MKTKIKPTLLALCALIVVTATVFTTLAYLTDKEAVVNTFTVGNVSISLVETDVDKDGDDQSNDYHLLPGKTYQKDPTLTVDAESEESYIRMILTVHNHSSVQAIIDNEKNNLNDYSDLLGGWDESVWLYNGFTTDADANTISFEFRYFETVDGFDNDGVAADEELPALFETLNVPGTLDGDELASLYEGGFKMVVEGHAIQSATFEDDEDGAWAAFDVQMGK